MKGLPVEVGINYHRVFSVDVTKSIADLVVWFRVSWYDPRLTWNPDDYGGVEKVWFWVGDGSGEHKSEIWSPDIELWNQDTSLKSLTSTHPIVTYDGKVYWSRPGHLRPVCNFEGLSLFPFDTLSCMIEIGSWVYSGKYLRPTLMDETGYTIGGSMTAGERYTEYKMRNVSAKVHVYPPFPVAPEPWPVIQHTVLFSRAWKPYIRGYLILQVILNLTAMACFWLPPHCGERISLGITALLAAVASDLVVSEKLPSASELTWVSTFSLVSLFFGAFVLFESAMVIYFYYLTEDTLIPGWAIWIVTKMRSFIKRMKFEREMNNSRQKFYLRGKEDSVVGREIVSSSATGEKTNQFTSERSVHGLSDPVTMQESDDMGLEEAFKENCASFTRCDEENREDSMTDRHVNFTNSIQSKSCLQESFTDNDQLVDVPNLDETPVPVVRSLSMRRGAIMPRLKSLELTAFKQELTGSTRAGIKCALGRDADDFKSPKEVQNNIRWQGVADKLDEICRVVVPLSYAIALGILISPIQVNIVQNKMF